MEYYKPLAGYWPEHLQEILEFAAIDTAADEELKSLWEAAAATKDDMYLSTMGTGCCSAIEAMLGITADTGDTLEDRRRRIKGYYMSGLPFTQNKLAETLTVLCGSSDGYTLTVVPSEYRVSVAVKLSNARLVDNIREIMEKMIPANMEWVVSTQYNTHGQIAGYTHEALSAYTQEQLRSAGEFQTEGDT